MIAFVFCMRKRPSSYSQISFDVLSGGVESCLAISEVIGWIVFEWGGCV